jgi:hypothetical protein
MLFLIWLLTLLLRRQYYLLSLLLKDLRLHWLTLWLCMLFLNW